MSIINYLIIDIGMRIFWF